MRKKTCYLRSRTCFYTDHKIGKMLGFHVTVLEDRPLFANHARSAGADIVICDNFESGLEQISGDKNTYYVLVTRGHRYDQECLRIICEKPYAYIGMIGSRKRVKTVIEQLEQEGTDPEVLKEVPFSNRSGYRSGNT